MSERLPQRWKHTPIGNHIDLLTDYTANGSFASLKENVTYYNEKNYAALVRTTDLQKPQFVPKRFTDKKGYEFLSKSSLKQGDIVIANVGSAGKAYRIPNYHLPMTLAPNMYLINFSKTLNADFAYQVITGDQFYNDLMNNIATTTLSAINKNNFRSIEILVPPLLEQQKIAAILSSADDVIDKTESQINKLQDLKKGMMQELLTKGIGHTEFKDSPVGKIPNGWEALTAKQMLDESILNNLQDGNHGSQYPRTSEFVKTGVHYLAASNISENGIIDFENCPRLTEKRAKQLRIPPAKGGDVILTHNATVGRVAIIPDSFNEVVVSTSTTYYRTNKERLLPEYLAQYFLSPLYQSQLKSIMGQTTRNQVPITAQRNLHLLLPPLLEQKKISSFLSSIDESIKQVARKNKRLLRLKKALMQDLLTGKVRVKTD